MLSLMLWCCVFPLCCSHHHTFVAHFYVLIYLCCFLSFFRWPIVSFHLNISLPLPPIMMPKNCMCCFTLIPPIPLKLISPIGPNILILFLLIFNPISLLFHLLAWCFSFVHLLSMPLVCHVSNVLHSNPKCNISVSQR